MSATRSRSRCRLAVGFSQSALCPPPRGGPSLGLCGWGWGPRSWGSPCFRPWPPGGPPKLMRSWPVIAWRPAPKGLQSREGVTPRLIWGLLREAGAVGHTLAWEGRRSTLSLPSAPAQDLKIPATWCPPPALSHGHFVPGGSSLPWTDGGEGREWPQFSGGVSPSLWSRLSRTRPRGRYQAGRAGQARSMGIPRSQVALAFPSQSPQPQGEKSSS